MSGSKVNNYTQLDTNILQLQLTSDANFKGKHLVSLTNYDTTSESKVAAGSIIEVGGALYKFDSDETILDTYSVSNGNVYIMIVPSTTTCTAVYTNTAPTWDDSKQGWYGTSGTAGYRYLEFRITKSGTTWSNKTRLVDERITTGQSVRTAIYAIGTWNMDSTDDVYVSHSLDVSKVIEVTAFIYADSDTGIGAAASFINTYASASLGGSIIFDKAVSRIWLHRAIGGYFDSTSYDDTSINRGYVVVRYID